MSHMSFVVLSYAVAFSILGALIAWLWIDARSTQKELTQLEDQGIKRRSEA